MADVFAFQNDRMVAAITSDGVTAWTADVSQTPKALPDFQGGLVTVKTDEYRRSFSIVKLDGITGQPYPAYTPVAAANGSATLGAYGGQLVAVHPDGTVFAVQQNSDRAGTQWIQ